MANICDFSMCVKGSRNDIENFYNALIQKGNIYMGRGAEAEINYDNEESKAFIDGWCKWSVQSALIDNAISMREQPDIWYFEDEVNVKELEFITLSEACDRWNLIVEVYSEECGCGFQEHYIIKKGNIEVDECIDWNEYFLNDYETKKEAEENLEIEITDEEWENLDVISRGGFKNWDFKI